MLKAQARELKVTADKPVVEPDSIAALTNNDQIKGKTIALHCHPANIVKAVVALDGVASAVLLVPYDACEAFSRRAEDKISIDLVITDGVPETKYWRSSLYSLSSVLNTLINFDDPNTIVTRWLLATSGTTGTPKIVAHTAESLTRTVSSKDTGEKLSWGLIYDPARFAGFQVILQALKSGSTLVIPSPELDISRKIDFLAANSCSALSATPSLWRKVLMSKSVQRLELKQVTLGGEIADQRVLNSLSNQFPHASISHIFASTEAGVGFSVKDKKAGFPSSWLEHGVRDVEMRISEQGTLMLKNTCLNQDYLGEAEGVADNEGWIDTGDLVEVVEERVLFKGRLNGAINVGGNKVIPEEVEEEILKVPGVFQVAVRAKPSSIAGSLVEAYVVPESDVENSRELAKKIKQHCKQVLPSFKVPAFVRLLEELPIGSSGKVKR